MKLELGLQEVVPGNGDLEELELLATLATLSLASWLEGGCA